MTAIANERDYVLELITRVVRECPRRQPTSDDERRASFIFKDEFERLGLATDVQGFEFNDNLYANLALHFGLGSATQADYVEIRWPDGATEKLEKVKANQFLKLEHALKVSGDNK